MMKKNITDLIATGILIVQNNYDRELPSFQIKTAHSTMNIQGEPFAEVEEEEFQTILGIVANTRSEIVAN